jgi:chitinase
MRVYGNGGLDFDGRDVKITGAIQKAKEWRSSNPNLKILIAIGGADYNFLSAWNSISANQQTRSYFASNIASKLEEYQLDGVDIDWEYPNNDPDTKPEEKGYFTSLLRDIKQRIGSSKILSTAIGAGSWRGDASYEIANIFSICDFVNVMTYDMHGSWFAQTGPHNALQGSNYVTVRSSIDYLLGKSVDRKKIIVGIATYGKVFYLENGDNNYIGAAIIRNRGSALNNSEICLKLRSNELTSQYSETYMVPYAFNRTAWISYENVRSVTEKANYIKNNGFGGAMFW